MSIFWSSGQSQTPADGGGQTVGVNPSSPDIEKSKILEHNKTFLRWKKGNLYVGNGWQQVPSIAVRMWLLPAVLRTNVSIAQKKMSYTHTIIKKTKPTSFINKKFGYSNFLDANEQMSFFWLSLEIQSFEM